MSKEELQALWQRYPEGVWLQINPTGYGREYPTRDRQWFVPPQEIQRYGQINCWRAGHCEPRRLRSLVPVHPQPLPLQNHAKNSNPIQN